MPILMLVRDEAEKTRVLQLLKGRRDGQAISVEIGNG